MPETNKPQLSKFKETAKQLETDDSEASFDRTLKKIVKSAPPSSKKPVPTRNRFSSGD